MNKRILTMILLLPLLAGGTVLMAQQGFGTNSPNPTSVVDMQAASKGLLIPRVELKATNVAAPISSPAHSLLVFNTAAAGVAPNNVTPGFYYWDDTAKVWVRLVNAGELNGKWNLTGNTETAPVLGTTDGKDMVLKTNSVDRLHISADGSVGVNTTTPASSAVLDVNSVSQGFLPPRMTTAQMDAIGSKVQGLVVYNTSRSCLAYYDGTAFKCFSDRPAAKVTKGSDFTTFFNGSPGGTYDTGAYGGDKGYVVTHSTGQIFSANGDCTSAIISAGGCGEITTVVGVSGYVYRLTEINGQCWLTENLHEVPSNYATYTGSGWTSSGSDSGYWGYYNSSTGGSWPTTPFTNKYGNCGLLYQWSAAMNGATTERSRGVCPVGFHIPSDCEFKYLEHGLGMPIKWQNDVTKSDTNRGTENSRVLRKLAFESTNATGFSAVYAGYRQNSGGLTKNESMEHWWTSTKYDATQPYYRKIFIDDYGIEHYYCNPAYGFSVRCLKD